MPIVCKDNKFFMAEIVDETTLPKRQEIWEDKYSTSMHKGKYEVLNEPFEIIYRGSAAGCEAQVNEIGLHFCKICENWRGKLEYCSLSEWLYYKQRASCAHAGIK